MASVTIIDNDNIKEFVELYVNNAKDQLPEDLRNKSINDWVVSGVTTMDSLFENYKEFNEPLGNWDVSNVTNMRYMFSRCESFNQPLNDWDVSKVNNMSVMFFRCLKF